MGVGLHGKKRKSAKRPLGSEASKHHSDKGQQICRKVTRQGKGASGLFREIFVGRQIYRGH